MILKCSNTCPTLLDQTKNPLRVLLWECLHDMYFMIVMPLKTKSNIPTRKPFSPLKRDMILLKIKKNIKKCNLTLM